MITILPLTTGLSGVLQSKENSINLIDISSQLNRRMAGGVYRPAMHCSIDGCSEKKKRNFGTVTVSTSQIQIIKSSLIAQPVDDCKTVRLWVSNRDTYYLVAHTTGFILTLFLYSVNGQNPASHSQAQFLFLSSEI